MTMGGRALSGDRGYFLANCLLAPIGLALYGLLICAISLLLAPYPSLLAVMRDLGLGFLLGVWTAADLLNPTFLAGILGVGLACAALLTAYLALWYWRRWGYYALIVLVAFGVVFGLYTPLGLRVSPPLHHFLLGLQFAGYTALLLGLLPLALLKFALKPYWARMK